MGTTESDLESYWKEEEEEEVLETTTALKRRPARGITTNDNKQPPEEELLLASPQSNNNADYINDAAVLVQLQVATAAAAAAEQEPPHDQSQLESERSVYCDTHDGTETCNETRGIKYSVAGHSVAEKNLQNEDSEFALHGVDSLKSQTAETDYQSYKNLKDEGKPNLHTLHSAKSSENGTAVCRPVDKPLHVGQSKESKQEVAEWDLERVLDEQETHDLYCPNCNSCITKRVILRKRKRKISNLQHESKREKTEANQSSSLSIGDRGHNTTLTGQGGIPAAVGTSGQDHETGPDLFRCLSCFSFFIPSVSGFKIFRIFGGRGEDQTVQNPQQIVPRDGAVTQGDGARQHVEEDAVKQLKSSQLPNHQIDQVSSALPVAPKDLVEPVNIAALKSKEDREGYVVSSTTSAMHQTVKNSVEEISYGATIENREDEKSATIFSPPTTTQLITTDSSEQLNISKSKLWIDEQNFQVSATSVSVHLVETQFNTDEAHSNAGKRIEGGFSSPYMDKNLAVNNIEPILSTPGTQSNGISNTMVEKDLSLIDGKYISIVSKPEALLPSDKHTEIGEDWESSHRNADAGNDVILLIRPDQVRPEVFESVGNKIESSAVTERYASGRQVEEARMSTQLDILKSIVYGGLMESITSLGVVSSAAGADATTLNIFALGLATVVSGLFIIAHGLMDLKNEQYGGAANHTENADRYQELLGRRTNFGLHATVAIMSYLAFGLVPPVTYGFSFRESNNKEYKLIAVAASSLLCIALLATVKAYVRKPPKAYIKTLSYYIVSGVMSSGLSYAFGMLIKKLMEKLGWFEPTAADPMLPPAAFLESVGVKPSWISY